MVSDRCWNDTLQSGKWVPTQDPPASNSLRLYYILDHAYTSIRTENWRASHCGIPNFRTWTKNYSETDEDNGLPSILQTAYGQKDEKARS